MRYGHSSGTSAITRSLGGNLPFAALHPSTALSCIWCRRVDMLPQLHYIHVPCRVKLLGLRHCASLPFTLPYTPPYPVTFQSKSHLFRLPLVTNIYVLLLFHRPTHQPLHEKQTTLFLHALVSHHLRPTNPHAFPKYMFHLFCSTVPPPK